MRVRATVAQAVLQPSCMNKFQCMNSSLPYTEVVVLNNTVLNSTGVVVRDSGDVHTLCSIWFRGGRSG